ncbi:hypothetical protein A6B40_09050 [Mannheimia varigena]|uniref:hypothetical protein n=1 Tax=Mannheimia varigena TaxID=85404 RepID=UPI001F33AD2D|nr:hypothetical protein [Mannheimia varigena]QLB17711.1 hypothetical protein A6B40_09050 [Mannheimia varigena]
MLKEHNDNAKPLFYDPNIKEYANPAAFGKIEALLNAKGDLQKNNQILPLVKVITKQMPNHKWSKFRYFLPISAT